MSRTLFLAAVAVAALLIQLVPSQAALVKWAAGGLGIAYLFARIVPPFIKTYLAKRRRSTLATADEAEYRQYAAALAAIRARYGFVKEPTEDLPTAQQYHAEVAALHARHDEMLKRKFGSA